MAQALVVALQAQIRQSRLFLGHALCSPHVPRPRAQLVRRWRDFQHLSQVRQMP